MLPTSPSRRRLDTVQVLAVLVLQIWLLRPLQGALALGHSCAGIPLGPGTADPQSPYWFETIKKQGTSPFNEDSDYKVFRNVKDYGAVGDGVTDDTVAINNAIADGNRCGLGVCDSSTLSPAVVYFPNGVYLVSTPVIAWYYTALVGDAKNPPTLLASPAFNGIAVIDADPYIPDGYGAQWYVNQNNFFRSVRNFIIDLRRVGYLDGATGLHWQVSQATSLTNVWIRMSSHSGTEHRGIFMENGSGGYMGDLIIEGGKVGMDVGNQQFTVRNVTIRDAVRGVSFIWNWGWTLQGLKIRNCVDAAVYMRVFSGDSEGSPITGGLVFIDAEIQDTPVFILASSNPNLDPQKTGSLVLDNVKLTNVPVALKTEEGDIVLAGGTQKFDHWIQGNRYEGAEKKGHFVQGELGPILKPHSLLDAAGNIFQRSRPVYADYALDQIVSVKDLGAKGDGRTDDTAVLQKILNDYAGCKIIYFDAGTYIITDTLVIPSGSRVIGEIWTEIMGSGPTFNHVENPKPVIRVGDRCSQDALEITDMLFNTRGPASGAIVVEWNAADPVGTQGAVGMWDSHIRLAASSGSHLGSPECSKQRPQSQHCFAAFLALYLTPSSTGYFEGTWIWLGDHDLDNNHDQITVFSGRGLLSKSKGPVWLIGTGSEHHVLYQFNLVNAHDHYMGLIQTETPYYQPDPIPPTPYRVRADWHDPLSYDGAAWALRIFDSRNILIYGAGFYSFFNNYDTACIKHPTKGCQSQIVSVDSISSVMIANLATVGTTYQLTVDDLPTIPALQNQNGFAAMLTSWAPSPKKRELPNKNWYTEMVIFPTFDAGYFLE